MKKAVEWVLNLVTTVIAQACSLDAKYVTIQGGGDWGKMTSIVKEIYNYLAIAGIAFTLVYFLMEMNEKLTRNEKDDYSVDGVTITDKTWSKCCCYRFERYKKKELPCCRKYSGIVSRYVHSNGTGRSG